MVLTKLELAMKRLVLATALLASLGACMSWHPSNDGPPRNTAADNPPPPAYVVPVR